MTPAKLVCKIGIMHLDEGWEMAIFGLDGLIEASIEGYPSPGAALDASVKWALDRGLVLVCNSTTFEVIKPGEETP